MRIVMRMRIIKILINDKNNNENNENNEKR